MEDLDFSDMQSDLFSYGFDEVKFDINRDALVELPVICFEKKIDRLIQLNMQIGWTDKCLPLVSTFTCSAKLNLEMDSPEP